MIKYYQFSAESMLTNKPFEEGSLYFIEDTKRIYLDTVNGSSRVLIGSDPIIISTEAERENLLAPIPGKFYFVLETSNIYIYDTSWHSCTGIDSTLSVSGMAADAKAVGDAIGKGGISNIQIVESDESGGNNVVNITLTDGSISTFNVKNGSNGSTPVRGEDYWTDEDISEIKSYVDEAILGGAW